MREDHHDFRTPKEWSPVFSNRKAKPHNGPSKKLHHQHQKSIKNNLGSVFTSNTDDKVVLNLSESIEKISSISESVEICESGLNSGYTLVSDSTGALQHPEESVGMSSISETSVFDEDQSSESIESIIASLNQIVSPSSVIPLSSPSPNETTPLSSISTVDMTPSSSSPITAEATAGLVSSDTRDGATEEETDSLKLESLVKHLRIFTFQVLHSADMDPQYKKLLEALVKMMIEEFYDLHQERDMVAAQLFSRKLKIGLLSFLLCVVASFIIFLDVQSSYHGPPPT